MDIRGLAYVVAAAPDLGAWEAFGGGVLGFERATMPDDDGLYFRLDRRQWRVAIERRVQPGLVAVGYEVVDGAALEQVERELEAAGVTVKDQTAELAPRRHVQAVLQAEDPAGNRLEFVYGARVESAPFVSPTGARFVTGDGGMGHVVLAVAHYDEALAFYRDVLGFRQSDVMRLGDARLAFLHCNPRHHTVAVVEAGVDAGLHHFMVEVEDIDSVGQAYDRCLAGAAPIEMTLGRHTNDHMISFYARSPSGFGVEYGCGGLLVDDATWVVTELDRTSFWGHTPVD